MDASYKIQRGIHVHLIQFFMCPEFWVHIILAKPVIRFFNGGKMKKFKAKIYLKNKKGLNEYLENLVKIKKNPTLEDVKFSFKWGTIPCDQ